MAGQREINANFSGNRLYACPNRVRDRPCFSDGPISQRSYGDRTVDLIHYPYSREASKNERACSASVQIGTCYANLSGNLLVDSRSDLRNELPGRLPLEAGVSICHINKVNPSPNRKPFPPARSARP